MTELRGDHTGIYVVLPPDMPTDNLPAWAEVVAGDHAGTPATVRIDVGGATEAFREIGEVIDRFTAQLGTALQDGFRIMAEALNDEHRTLLGIDPGVAPEYVGSLLNPPPTFGALEEDYGQDEGEGMLLTELLDQSALDWLARKKEKHRGPDRPE